MSFNKIPLVSIQCLVYNHEPFLRQCLDGFVMQKTDFPFEAIVHDDASTDNSAEIIREYAEKYPDIIKPIFETENQYSKKDGSLGRIMNEAIHPGTKYIAYCEGDDYWTDPMKLQIQIDYLECHSDVNYSCHRFFTKNEFDGSFIEGHNNYFDNPIHSGETEFEFDLNYAFLGGWTAQTLTQIIRRTAINIEFKKSFRFYRDVHLFYDVLSKGKGVCHNFFGGVYNINHTSIYGKLPLKQKLIISYNLYDEFYDVTKADLIKKMLVISYKSLLRNGIFRLPKHWFELVYLPVFFIYILKSLRVKGGRIKRLLLKNS